MRGGVKNFRESIEKKTKGGTIRRSSSARVEGMIFPRTNSPSPAKTMETTAIDASCL